MARPGPRPMAARLRLLHGDHPERINRSEPKPRAVLPECPPEASDDVREIWDYLVAELTAMRVVSAADRDCLYALCCAISVHRQASAVLARTKILVRSARDEDRLIRNPVLSVMRDAAVTIRLLCGEFGLSPASRSGIRVRATGDPVDDLLG